MMLRNIAENALFNKKERQTFDSSLIMFAISV